VPAMGVVKCDWCQAKVRQAGPHVGVEQDVGRLDVMVENTRLDAVVHVPEPPGHVQDNGPVMRPRQRQPRAFFAVVLSEDVLVQGAVGHVVVHEEHLIALLDVVIGDAAREHAMVHHAEPATLDDVAVRKTARCLRQLADVEQHRPGVGLRAGRPSLRDGRSCCSGCFCAASSKEAE
jgi:hypothetical protein